MQYVILLSVVREIQQPHDAVIRVVEIDFLTFGHLNVHKAIVHLNLHVAVEDPVMLIDRGGVDVAALAGVALAALLGQPGGGWGGTHDDSQGLW